MNLYPFKFIPILKDKIWGGEKLGTVLDKPVGESKTCGESWEISGVEGDISVVAEGELAGKNLVELIDQFKGELVGDNVYQKFGKKFPLLIKFIDANDDLSIQVHPDDELGMKRHNSFGKTEMWYVVDAEEGATLISGFNKQTSKEEYLEVFESGRLMNILNRENVYNDDVFFLPAGRVHTIGKGLLIAEIQQTSDITYRIYDFDRVDANGIGRELHVEEAVDAIDYNYYDEYKTQYDQTAKEAEIGESQYFITNRLLIEESIKRNYSTFDSCIILMVLEGEGSLKFDGGSVSYKLGDSILVPNSISSVLINAEFPSKLLEVRIP
ncbi:MAG: class I mannose-6-phosphate isomerase [Balneolaceae bacterium]|nr:class I mannose-6-phosphate isomerase [Balneolaceae bacterium]MBO6546230.1 class I mannose-6-phosphate isomerase [Balneolaceae bacterium]MBO6648589.1 class I mannose-6-phosphate isomerase [Balneolaceae bacterium]